MKARQIGLALLAVAAVGAIGAVLWGLRGGADDARPTDEDRVSEAATDRAHEGSGGRDAASPGNGAGATAGAGSTGTTGAITPPLADAGFMDTARANTLTENAGAYSIARSGGGHVAVSLIPGRNLSIPAIGDARQPGPRTVRGRVTTSDGKPAVGATVLAADRLIEMMNSLGGYDAVVTASDGSYVLLGLPDTALQVIAMHPGAGWSQPRVLPAGSGDATVDLVIPPPGSIEGKITRGGHPVAGSVRLAASDTNVFSRAADAGPDGMYRLYPVAPGTYTLTAKTTGELAMDQGRTQTVTVTVANGQVVLRDFDQPAGVTMHVAVAVSAQPRTVTYYLGRGHGDGAALLIDEHPEFPPLLLGGGDATRDMTWHDLDAGDYTVCVRLDAPPPHRADGGVPPVPATCAPITLAATPADQRFTIRLP